MKINKKYGLGMLILVLVLLTILLPIAVGTLKYEEGYNDGLIVGNHNAKFLFPNRWHDNLDMPDYSSISFDKSANTIIVDYDRHTFREVAYYICLFGWDVKIPYTMIVNNNTMLEDWDDPGDICIDNK